MYAIKKLNASSGTIARSIFSKRRFSSLDFRLGASGLTPMEFSTQDSGSGFFSAIVLVISLIDQFV